MLICLLNIIVRRLLDLSWVHLIGLKVLLHTVLEFRTWVLWRLYVLHMLLMLLRNLCSHKSSSVIVLHVALSRRARLLWLKRHISRQLLFVSTVTSRIIVATIW